MLFCFHTFLWWFWDNLLLIVVAVQSLGRLSDSLQPCGLQHSRLPCPSLPPRVCSNSGPLNRWCYLTISSSIAPFSFWLHLSQHQALFQWVSSSHQMDRTLEHQHQSFQLIFWVDFLQDWQVWSPCSPKGPWRGSDQYRGSIYWCINCVSFLVQVNRTFGFQSG